MAYPPDAQQRVDTAAWYKCKSGHFTYVVMFHRKAAITAAFVWKQL